MIWLLLACGSGQEEPAPPRVEPKVFASSPTWVRNLTTDATHAYWTNYDNSTGRSERAVIQAAPLDGGPARVLASEAHPPEHLAVHGGFLYWSYGHGSLKRVPVGGGEVERLVAESASCFSVDDSGIYFIRGVELIHLDPATRESRVVVQKALATCPVALGSHVYWIERKAIHRAPKTGSDGEKFVPLKKCESLQAREGALFTCYDDKVTRIDPDTGEHSWVRGYCKGEHLAVADTAHWFPQDHYSGWPPLKQTRIVEVTANGPSHLFDGPGASPPVVTGDRLVWFGQRHGQAGWSGLSAPLPPVTRE